MTDENDYDVIVIGGGSTGTAVARDCAMRGLKTLLLERDDIASATVGTCAGMISSGLKYMEEPEIVDMCSAEVIHLNKIAQHIIAKNPILTPMLEMSDLSTGGNFAEEYSKRAAERDVPPVLFLTPEDSLEIEPMLSPDIIASMYFEEFFIDPFRLCLLQALDTRRHGGDVKTYAEVTDILVEDGDVRGVEVFDRKSGEVSQFTSSVVVNATGPWAHKIAALADAPLELRLNKGAHVILDRRVVNVGVVAKAVDGRMIYLFPHENTVLLGTTALDTWDDPDTLTASHDEIEYLLKSIEWVVPSIREARIIRTMEGVRPLIATWKVPEDDVTRGYEIVDHDTNGVSGLLSFTGGKLVMCRHMAEAVTDTVCAKLGIEAECRTHLEPLPGNEEDVDVLALAEEYDVSQHAVERMRARRGTETEDILALTREHPSWKSTICTCEPVIEAEVRYSIRNEFPETINDLRRRLRVGTGPCQGTFCTFKVAAILAEERELDTSTTHLELVDYLSERWKGKRPPLRGEQLAQEEVVQALYACVANLDRVVSGYEPSLWEESL
ncbi:FAD-dependent oxidoreductase [Candidatus Thorarchaeota archaeon]|nr:MAG: FAD-dependent oxidoreductase [Candidatus Thorarchaeota archaeon]